jgi:hypothetical protein
MNKIIVVLFLLFSFSTFAKNIDHFRGSWLCIEEHGVGFNWNRNTSKWDPASNYEKSKYIFKTVEDSECWGDIEDEEICAQFYDFGEEPLMARPYNYFERSEYNKSAFIEGHSLLYGFSMSEKGQFIKEFNIPGDVSDRGAEFSGMKNYKDSMMLFVGSCSKI